MIGRLRKGRGAFDVFAPVEDLSRIARGERGVELVGGPRKWLGAGAGGEVIGDEWARQIVRVSLYSSVFGLLCEEAELTFSLFNLVESFGYHSSHGYDPQERSVERDHLFQPRP